jgi:hypothetical protein
VAIAVIVVDAVVVAVAVAVVVVVAVAVVVSEHTGGPLSTALSVSSSGGIPPKWQIQMQFG